MQPQILKDGVEHLHCISVCFVLLFGQLFPHSPQLLRLPRNDNTRDRNHRRYKYRQYRYYILVRHRKNLNYAYESSQLALKFNQRVERNLSKDDRV